MTDAAPTPAEETPTAPCISVIMPVYNAEPFVADAIESVLGQTFSDFEFLIIDDGSTDGSAGVIADYAERDPRIRFLSRENRGLAATLNELAALARGPFLARMDADDICRPERFERQMAFLAEEPDIDVLGTWSLLADRDMRPIMTVQFPVSHEENDSDNLVGHTSMAHSAVIMRREAFEKAGGYRTEYNVAEDLDLWLRMAEHGRLANLPEVLFEIRALEDSISARNILRQREIASAACRDAWERRGLSDMEYEGGRNRPLPTRTSRRDFALKWAWQAWNSGYQDTAQHYFRKALRIDPLSIKAWKGLIFGTLRRPD